MTQPPDRSSVVASLSEPSTMVLVPEDLIAAPAGLRSRTNPPRPPSGANVPIPRVATKSAAHPSPEAALSITSRLAFLVERLGDRKAAPFWGPLRTGVGAYAEVYRVEVSAHHPAAVLERQPLRHTVIAKLFRDGAPEDHAAVYTGELQALRALGGHAHVVGLRGAIDAVPPTFVCGHADCGRVFHVERCPQCDKPLHNIEGRDIGLSCPDRHRFLKYNAEQVKALTRARPCKHADECSVVNFLYRPCILEEELDLDLRALGQAIAGAAVTPAGKAAAIAFESKPGSDDRRREALLLRLDTLIGVAEGLAFLHAQGWFHAGVAPENAMVRLAATPDGKGLTPTAPDTRLIDLGLARKIKDSHVGAGAAGAMTFLAPEQMVASGSLGPTVAIRFRGGVPREGELCRIASAGGELAFERRDLLRDADEGQYEVVADADVPAELRAALGDARPAAPADHARVRYARVLRPPRAGRDLPQTSLRFTYALDVPADIYALGCLIAWSVTGGQEDLVHLLREQANLATRQRQVVGGGFSREFLRDDHKKLLAAIDLPPIDGDDLQAALLDAVIRCLVRGEGAYCTRRSSGFERPALAVASELRRVRNALFARMHSPDDVPGPPPEFAGLAQGDADRLEALTHEVDTLARALAAANARAAEAEAAALEVQEAHAEAQQVLAEAQQAITESEQASAEVEAARARAGTDAGRIAALTRELESLRAAHRGGDDGDEELARRVAVWRAVAVAALVVALVIGLVAARSVDWSGDRGAQRPAEPSPVVDPAGEPPAAPASPAVEGEAPPTAETTPPAAASGEPSKPPAASSKPDKPRRGPSMQALTARSPAAIRQICEFPADARGMFHLQFTIDSATRRLIRVELDKASGSLEVPGACVAALEQRFRGTNFGNAADFRSSFRQTYTVLASE
ncbi:MAG: protein kinase [Myxococcales bacterium]|nr:protein kinase [Myxococcales bacterium]